MTEKLYYIDSHLFSRKRIQTGHGDPPFFERLVKKKTRRLRDRPFLP